MALEIALARAIRGELRSRGLDLLIARLAAAQHGVVSRSQLLAFGASPDAVDRRIVSGRLIVIHRGVYAVGHRELTREGHWMAAVLAGGEGASLSDHSAAALWSLPVPQRGGIHVTTARARHSRVGLKFHARGLLPDEVTEEGGIPVTTVARTLLDLASALTPHQLERAVKEAEYRRLADLTPLATLMERHPHVRGAAALRRIRALPDLGHGRIESDLEVAFIAFCDDRALPRPRTNHWLEIGGTWIRPDCVWLEQRVIVELDGRAAHDRPASFHADRERDRRLLANGWRSARVTGLQIREQPDELDADLRAILAA